MPRLFIAAWAGQAVRERAQETALALRGRGLDARFYAPEQLHATLAFLGMLGDQRTAAVEAACAAAAAAETPFELIVDRLGGFPNTQRASVLWLGTSGSDAAFRGTANALRERLRESEIAYDAKEALAHVTIARAKVPVRLPALEVAPVRWAVGEIALVQSATLPEGARYRTLARWRLGG
ncbi:RNA 2',3'-cyclic phosphodiesterase [bacterium]|nr:MAG: RNA 2',3'-cyclic phosphodiesterase [bacterium]